MKNVSELKEIAARIRYCQTLMTYPKCHCGIMGCIHCSEVMDAEREMLDLVKYRGDLVANSIEAACADTFTI